MLNSSIWRAVLSLFYPPVIIGGKNGKNSENPVGSNKSEKRKPKSAVYRSFWASVVYFHLRLISTKSHKREMTRNQVVAQAARGFESHPIRHIAGAKFALLRLFYVQISSIFAFGDFPFAFKTPALRQSKPCLHCLRRGYFGAVVEMGITADEGSTGGYVAFQLRS